MLNQSSNPKHKVFQNSSLLHLSHLSVEEIVVLFEEAKSLQELARSHPKGDLSENLKDIKKGVAALLFFENSTRTRMSFETATNQLGLHPVLLDAQSGSSLLKGETLEDTIKNVAALDPQVLIIRCGDQLDLAEISTLINRPIVNAGWGAKGHPTQALLDLFTLWKERTLSGLRLLFVGDVVHSRVVSSHFEICHRLGIEVACCGPEKFKPQVLPTNIHWHTNLSNALEWCDVVMALRVQTERHSDTSTFFAQDYHQQFGITKEKLKRLKPQGMLLHPGPVNWGVELATEIQCDAKVRILQQVNNGLYLRMALLKLILSL